MLHDNMSEKEKMQKKKGDGNNARRREPSKKSPTYDTEKPMWKIQICERQKETSASQGTREIQVSVPASVLFVSSRKMTKREHAGRKKGLIRKGEKATSKEHTTYRERCCHALRSLRLPCRSHWQRDVD